MKLRPLGNHVIVEPALKETKTASGIIIPDTVESHGPTRGTVIAVGAGRVLDNGARQAIDVVVGEKVLVKKLEAWEKIEVEIEDNGTKKKYLVVKIEDIIAATE